MTGRGSPEHQLNENDVLELCEEFIEREKLRGKRILAVIPDQTRSAPIDMMFRVLYRLLATRSGILDFLIALGTHPPMSEEAIDKRLGCVPGERARSFGNVRIFNHQWNNPAQLTSLGTISASQVAEISGGMMCDPVNVTINRMVLEYDVVLIVGPTFPHEVVGFSGGNKYLFPGIAGPEIIDMFH